MAKEVKRVCPECGQEKLFRSDQKTCGCVNVKPAESSEVSGDDWTITLPKTRIHTLEQLLTYFEVDLSVWEVKRFICNKWEVAAKDALDELQVEPLYQVKAFLERKTNIIFAKKEIEGLKEEAKAAAKNPFKIKKNPLTGGYMLEINLIDHHFGKMAWQVETGHPNYDIHIAVDLFWRAFNAILAQTKGFNFDEIYFIVGNDLFNSDDVQGRTTSGTHVSTDARFYKVFSKVRSLTIQAIEVLREYSKMVRVIMVSGNHDKLSVWHLGDSLECFFHKYKDVIIDNRPLYYKYYQFGQVMLMFTHGDLGKKANYPLMMATEQSEMFGNTKFREVHVGHKHFKEVIEDHGVRVRQLPALCPPDRWHAENGYTGNLRQTEAFIWNESKGLVGTVIYTDDDLMIPPPTEPEKE
jgi:hypothetical protein